MLVVVVVVNSSGRGGTVMLFFLFRFEILNHFAVHGDWEEAFFSVRNLKNFAPCSPLTAAGASATAAAHVPVVCMSFAVDIAHKNFKFHFLLDGGWVWTLTGYSTAQESTGCKVQERASP